MRVPLRRRLAPAFYALDSRQRVLAPARDDHLRPGVSTGCFRVDESTVPGWLRRVREAGRVAARPHGGGMPPKVDAAGAPVLETCVTGRNERPPAELADGYGERTGVALTAAVRRGIVLSRIGRLYLLGLELTDADIDASVLSGFRSRPVIGGAGKVRLTTLQAASLVSLSDEGGGCSTARRRPAWGGGEQSGRCRADTSRIAARALRGRVAGASRGTHARAMPSVRPEPGVPRWPRPERA